MRISGNAIPTPASGLVIPSGRRIATDTETTGLNPWKGDRIYCFSFCNEEGKTGYVRWKVDPFTRTPIIEPKSYALLKGFYEDPSITKILHNAKFDIRMMEMIGIHVKGRIEDTMFMMHVLQNIEITLALKPICKKYLDIGEEDQAELREAVIRARREAKRKGWKIAVKSASEDDPVSADYWLAPDQFSRRYCVRDSERAMMLFLLLNPMLDEEKLREVYEDEMKLWPVTYRMESRGVRVYPEIMDEEMRKNNIIIKRLAGEMKTLAPSISNFNSPKQLCRFFYQKCNLPVAEYTDNGNPSVNNDALQKIKHPLAVKIIHFKTAMSANETFFGRYTALSRDEIFNGQKMRILHPNFNQIGPTTGRYSCRQPNLQNVANPYGAKKVVAIPARKAFGPRPGYRWWHFDFKQVELWMFFSPSMSNDADMLKFMLAGGDVPSRIGQQMGWGEKMKAESAQGSEPTRIRVKQILYGTIYGIGAKGLGEFLGITKDEARKDLELFKSAAPTIDQHMKRMIRKAEALGSIRGPMGRKFCARRHYEYVITNHLVQGSGAQVLKRSMYLVDQYFREAKLDAHLVLTVHDELAAEIKIGQDNLRVIKNIQRILEGHGVFFGLPKLPVDVERVDKYWMEKTKMDI